MLSVKQAAHLQSLIEDYAEIEYESGHYTAVAYCTDAKPSVIAMAKKKHTDLPVDKLRDLLLKELAQLTDWSKV